jgi:hypothetical protein
MGEGGQHGPLPHPMKYKLGFKNLVFWLIPNQIIALFTSPLPSILNLDSAGQHEGTRVLCSIQNRSLRRLEVSTMIRQTFNE